MASFSMPIDAIATGTINNNGTDNVVSVDADGLVLVHFLEDQGFTPDQIANAQIVITFDDSTITTNPDGDPVVGNGTLITGFVIDMNGDGIGEYMIGPENPNQATLLTTNQNSGNVAHVNGTFDIYNQAGDVVGTVGPEDIYLNSNGSFVEGQDTVIVPDPNQDFNLGDLDVICFARGTLIDTPDGSRPIEDLAIGDLVLTQDHGARPIRWIGSRKVTASALKAHPRLRPIRISAGALGPNLPTADLVVSPQHRVLVTSRIVKAMFDDDQVLVPAKKLLGFPGIAYDSPGPVEYFHLLMDEHEVIRANGALTETLLAGPMALRALGPDACREIALLFPELGMGTFTPVPARRIAASRQIGKLVERHLKHSRDLVESEAVRRQA